MTDPRTEHATFLLDPTDPSRVRFTCAACGFGAYLRVSVKRPLGARYTTEFVSCRECRVMYHWPDEVPRPPQPDPRLSSGEYRPLSADTFGWTPTGAMTEEDLQRIKEAAAQANKSKGNRRRR